MKKLFYLLAVCLLLGRGAAAQAPGRERLLMDFDWRFAYGHAFDPQLDFNHGTGSFSYYAKTGYGDGAAAPGFDDRSWRQLDLPHDWAVEVGFSPKASLSHGFKAIGRPFPESSVGWYRKSFKVPATDLGRRLALEFDGVFRNSQVWINGHHLGTEPSGYNGFQYDISDYLNYGGDNVVAVRVDATMEEGWFYEGAGIYRHVWLSKTAPVHVAYNGTFVSTAPAGAGAAVTARTTLVNDGSTAQTVEVTQEIVDASGKTVASSPAQRVSLRALARQELSTTVALPQARLWSLDDPYRYQLRTRVKQGGQVADRYDTMFGVRTVRFDANQGFFLNGQRVALHGTNNHQDHAGVGAALPDALQDFRIRTLKAMGVNAYRCSHNPPTPELLEACDRLGMLVLDEVRLLGSSALHLADARRLMERDRNHPSVIAWSMGNEEWSVEGNETGARLAAAAQRHAKTLDSTRAVTVAISGGWGNGISTVVDVMGYNYIVHGSTDAQHAKFPNQAGMGTEEGATHATRGIYQVAPGQSYAVAYDRKGLGSTLQEGWQHYAARPYLAGMFIWTGFDYRGEPSPFQWPANVSSFGMLDLCGFPKDNAYYLRAWWGTEPILHLLPHWNWPGREGQPVEVVAYGNCDEVELYLNKKSLGRQPMPRNGHLSWQVPYTPGTLEAVGYRAGQKTLTDVVRTTGPATALALAADRTTLSANRQDVSVVTVRLQDKNQLLMPTAGNDVSFALSGPGKIIGVGNGDPTSLEADKFLETIQTVRISKLEERPAENLAPENLTASVGTWAPAYSTRPPDVMPTAPQPKAYVYRGSFEVPALDPAATVTFFYRSLGPEQALYLNGQPLARNLAVSNKADSFVLDKKVLKVGRNELMVMATPFVKKHSWESFNTDPGLLQIVTPAAAWHRKAFNGLAQVLVQTTGASGTLTLTATAPGLKPATLKLTADKAR
ncbi:MAG TPA: beta-galactosidase GalA [Hymenobacter sp.]|jgi:beta-galactosidase|uniref:beta-galactosidase GalA n=1 Tax=Hymenobacter sp. TaxID=1898978 RepID=UPI002ED8E100